MQHIDTLILIYAVHRYLHLVFFSLPKGHISASIAKALVKIFAKRSIGALCPYLSSENVVVTLFPPYRRRVTENKPLAHTAQASSRFTKGQTGHCVRRGFNNTKTVKQTLQPATANICCSSRQRLCRQKCRLYTHK